MPASQAEAATAAAPLEESITVPGDVAFRSQVAHLQNNPPDSGIAGAALDAAIAGRKLFEHGGRTVGTSAIRGLWLHLYTKSSRGVVVITVEQAAHGAGFCERQTATAFAVMRSLQLISCDDARRGAGTRIELTPGGMNFAMARRVVATAVAQNRATAREHPPSPESPDMVSARGDMMSPLWAHGGSRTTPPPRAREDASQKTAPGTASTGSGSDSVQPIATPAAAPAVARPSTPAQRLYAEDLGVASQKTAPGTASTGSGSDSVQPIATPAAAPAVARPSTPAQRLYAEDLGVASQKTAPGTASTGSGSDSVQPIATPAAAPAVARPSTPAQRLYAEDLGVTVDDIDIGRASEIIHAARVSRFPATTPAAAPAVARPSTPEQRLYAKDLGVTVDDVGIGEAGKIIHAARFRLFVADVQATTAAKDAARGGARRGHRRYNPPRDPHWQPGGDGFAEFSVQVLEPRAAAARDPDVIRADKRRGLEDALKRFGQRSPKACVDNWRRDLHALDTLTDDEILERWGRK